VQEPIILNESSANREVKGENTDIVANNLTQRLQVRTENAAQPPQLFSIREIMGQFPTLPVFRDEGFFDIQLDIDAFVMLLEEMGLENEAAQFSISVTSGKISDLDFYGDVVGGITNKNGDVVIYSSIPHHALATPGETLHKNNWHNLAVQSNVLVNTILHELRHAWQVRVAEQNLVGSMAASDHDGLETEKDAIAFAEKLTPIMETFLRINGVHEGPDSSQIPQVDPLLASLVDLTQGSVRVIDTEINNFNDWYESQLQKAEQGKFSSDEITGYCAELRRRLETEKIGFLEWRYLLKELQKRVTDSQPEDSAFIEIQLHVFDQEVAAQSS